MTGRSLTASIKGIEKAEKALQSNSLNKTALARDLGFSRSTVTNFFRQIPIERLNFEEICTKLGLDWQDIVDITANETEIEEIENTIFKDPNFLGREEDIANLNNLVNEGKKVILIKAEGGIGKTTLAENWFKIQGLEYLKLNVGTTSQNIQSVEDWVKLKLKDYFQVPPLENFMTMLEQFKIELQNLKIGILIDNLEPVIKNGEFIELHKNYVDLLEILANQNIQVITIITSREQISEHKIFRLPTFYNYDLEGLNEKTWQEYFENKEIIIDNDSLNAIWRNYGGNAEAMSLLAADILNESKGDLKAYWQDNSEDLLRHRSLEQLVKSQFDKLRNDNLQAYNLLCRVGVYPNQDINLPEIWLSCLLWDVPKNKRKRVIKDLLSCCLIKKHGEDYYLHPVIRVEAEATQRFNLVDKTLDNHLMLIKKELDNSIADNPQIQSWLEWINKKLLLLSNNYKKSAFCAFYLSYLIYRYEKSNPLYFAKRFSYYELASKLDYNFYFLLKGADDFIEQKADQIIDENIEIIYNEYLRTKNELIYTKMNEEIFKTFLDIIIFFIYDYQQLETILTQKDELKKILTQLIGEGHNILESTMNFQLNDFKHIKSGNQEQRQEFINEYKRINHITDKVIELNIYDSLFSIFEKFILGTKWQSFLLDKIVLKSYYCANLLLINCLYLTSPEIRSYIEDTLFLPIEEIENRPFKYQG